MSRSKAKSTLSTHTYLAMALCTNETYSIDFTDHSKGRTYLIIVDAHSKWPEVLMTSSTTSQMTIEVLSTFFERYGLPEQLISDKGPQFTSQEFEGFMKQRGINTLKVHPIIPLTYKACAETLEASCTYLFCISTGGFTFYSTTNV